MKRTTTFLLCNIYSVALVQLSLAIFPSFEPPTISSYGNALNAPHIDNEPWMNGSFGQPILNNVSEVDHHHPKNINKTRNSSSVDLAPKSSSSEIRETTTQHQQLSPSPSSSSNSRNQSIGARQEREYVWSTTPKPRELKRKKQRKNLQNKKKIMPIIIEASTTKPSVRQEKRLTEKGARRRAERRKERERFRKEKDRLNGITLPAEKKEVLKQSHAGISSAKHGKKRPSQGKATKKKNEQSSTTTLDALLPRYHRAKRRGSVAWHSKSPLPTAYFSITIDDKRSRKEKRNLDSAQEADDGGDEMNRKALGNSSSLIGGFGKTEGVWAMGDYLVYATGLNMPVGYTQTMEGHLQDDGRALIRVLDPDIAGPFAEFKIRVENRYGSPCKQMCLVGPAGKQRYRRCARKVVRLSTHAKFSDPIQFYKPKKPPFQFESEEMELEGSENLITWSFDASKTTGFAWISWPTNHILVSRMTRFGQITSVIYEL